MKVIELLNRPKQAIIQAYETADFQKDYFQYERTDLGERQRLQQIDDTSFNREALQKVIAQFMKQYRTSERIEHHLEQITHPEAVFVVGGQQAGLLTGPLYSVHKAISVILYAKEQTERYDRPFIPLFWVAGEDHDIDEINHMYVEKNGQLHKAVYSERSPLKKMATHTEFDRETMHRYVDQMIRTFRETTYTKEILRQLHEAVDATDNYTSFFVYLMNEFFNEAGLLYIDAAYEPFKQIQVDALIRLVEQNEAIAEAVVKKERQYAEVMGQTPLQATLDNAHLFYVHDTGRLLLKREGEQFIYEPLQLRWSKEEIIEEITRHPERFSNDVVTRPIMQQMMLPTFAFLAGPGELAYWATLKEAFQAVDVAMPLLIPRHSITLVPRDVQYALQQLDIPVEKSLDQRYDLLMERHMEKAKDEQFLAALHEAKNNLEQALQQLQQTAPTPSVQRVLQKNKQYHEKQFDYVEQFYDREIALQEETMIRRLRTVERQLLPEGAPQERMYTPYYYVNEYGLDLIEKLLKNDYSWNDCHKIVIL